ncbi:cbb3-type cytochrome c oxidase subunit I (plasmid) [Mesorhizobium sp. AR02]|uniref:cbb3-type cytochrome c oxidase subunit I n=1 Tax=Mesorhizobium sp. AR02 TaxID=2865837 RepID=UPI0021607C1F|nr:cbb3-type cytochrome c oxidase subunit I [Mesorhizobium sp. AR02]UVK57590.1 cbb3-type cytochrome c oxidase subunit I [Mesorhizobium sp. AR02]
MPKVSDLFFKTAVVWLILGICAGLQMAISGDHSAFPAHAHINLLGWVTSAIFGGYCALNPAKAERKLAMVHYGLYNVGLVVMLPALYLMLQGNTALEPVVAVGSLIVAAAVLLFAFVVFSSASVRSASELSPATR